MKEIFNELSKKNEPVSGSMLREIKTSVTADKVARQALRAEKASRDRKTTNRY
jgi:hypothetical protein